MKGVQMIKPNVLYIKNSKAAVQALEEFNQLTALNWSSLPKSLLPNGLVLNTREAITTR